jgi:hypothetical protein
MPDLPNSQMPPAQQGTTPQPSGQQVQQQASGVQTPPPAIPPTPPAQPVSQPPVQSGSSSKQKMILVIGLLAVLAVAGTGAYFLSQQKPDAIAPMTKVKETPKKVPLTLTLESPTDGELVMDSTLQLTGKTSPNTTIVFFSETAEGTTESDTAGNFSGQLALENGINTVTVTAYSAEGEEISQVFDIVYDETGGTDDTSM